MILAAKVFAGLAAALHGVFFCVESLAFSNPTVQARLKLTPEQADAAWIWAFNQGFYNLFLAIGCAVGIALASSKPQIGWTLIVHACLVMVGAGVVLVASKPALVTGAVIQAGPPAVALTLCALARRSQPAAT